MGIRFYCPNGHKMNVKRFLAGKKGICPVCGVTMPIPTESTRPSSRKQPPGPSEAGPSQAAVAEPSPTQLTQPAPKHIKKSDSSAAIVFAASPESDPLDAANAVWFVQPPEGDRLGPLSADAFRRHLDQGRLGADWLVWREGWSTWKEAGEVFGQLSPGKAASYARAIESEPAVSLVADFTPKPQTPPKKIQMMAFGVLGFTVLILLVLFLLLWMRS